MSKCYLCGQELTNKNKSLEHIIPNALGGKLKAYILCKTCNSKMGETIDSNLVKIFELFNIMTSLKRDRKTQQKIQVEVDGQKAFLQAEQIITSPFVPKITETENGKNIEFNGSFTNKKDEENFFKKAQKCVNGLSKNKQYTLDEIKALAKIETKQPIIYHQFTISLNDLFLGYLKILLGLCAFKDKIQYVSPKIITIFKEQNLQEINAISTLCKNDIFENNKTAHRIYLTGNQNTKKLFGLVSIYGFCAIFMLNDNYQGENFRENYCYDAYQSKEIDTNLELNLDIEKCYFEILKSNLQKATDILLEYFRKFTADIARKSKKRLSNIEFNHKLCEVIFKEKEHNRELAMLLQDEKGVKNLIMNEIWFYAFYNIVYNNPTMPIS